MRREIPEPLIALLCFILGIWLWDSYLGENEGYPPGTEQITLVRIDRSLHLAEAMAKDSPVLRWLANADTLEGAIDDGIRSLETLLSAQALGPTGLRAYAALLAAREGIPVADYLNRIIIQSEETESPTWWNLKINSKSFEFAPSAASATLRNRAIAVGSIIWGLGIMGLAFLPRALCCLGHAFRNQPKGYTAAWAPSLGLFIFLVATLAWIGFKLVLETGIAQLPSLHPVLLVLLDTSARILPALIAVGLLFRRPSHVFSRLGLNGDVHPPVLIGLFALLIVIDQALRWILAGFVTEDPTGGLSYADSGVFGLVFLIVSACIVAPLSEEVLYRGVLFRSLSNKLGVLVAAILSSVIFASLHFYDGYGLASVAIFGFICALLYQSTGSLADVIILHMFYNSTITIPEWAIYHAPL